MKIVSGAKHAALQARLRLAEEEAEKRDADRVATINRLRNQLDQQRDANPDTPLQQPTAPAGAAELQRRLNLALRANGELAERLGQMQDSHIADTRELHDLRQKGATS